MNFVTLLSKWRLWAVVGLLSLLPLALIWHLAHLQVIPGQERGFNFLQSAGEARTLRNIKINAYRGVITDRNGELLAVSTPVTSIFANPTELNEEEYPALAKALKMPLHELRQKSDLYQNKQFMYLKRSMPPHEAEVVLDNHFKGVYGQEAFRRYYPAGEVAAHIVGFTNVDDQGQEGVELSFNDWLSGVPGAKKVVKDLRGNIVREMGVERSPKSGKDLQLTIDMRLQYLAYRELKKAIARQGAKAGSMVMMDPYTGEILAAVNSPSYNPNNRYGVKAMQLRNRAFTDVFEPGSTMKPFTVMAALETGEYTPDYEIDTTPGHVFVGRKMIPDPVNYGVMTLAKIIKKSSQVGITKLALGMEPHIIRDMYYRVGFGQATGTGFPGESSGILPNHIKWRPVEQATFAYGYGLNVNAVQLAQAYSVIASGGKFSPATLIKQDDSSNRHGEQIIDPKITGEMTQMLKGVIERGGTGTGAALKEYKVAGKTGTAHKVLEMGGYADNKYMALFAGFAPADHPEIVAVVVVNEPPSSGAYSGGKAAAPIFGGIMDQALRVLRVPPDTEPPSPMNLADIKEGNPNGGKL